MASLNFQKISLRNTICVISHLISLVFLLALLQKEILLIKSFCHRFYALQVVMSGGKVLFVQRPTWLKNLRGFQNL
jgi:hypothetical protein